MTLLPIIVYSLNAFDAYAQSKLVISSDETYENYIMNEIQKNPCTVQNLAFSLLDEVEGTSDYRATPYALDLSDNFGSIKCISKITKFSAINGQIDIYYGTSPKLYNLISVIFFLISWWIRKYIYKAKFFLLILIFNIFQRNLLVENKLFFENIYDGFILTALLFILIYLSRVKLNRSINSEYRKEIDGLRALAVIFVIFNHYNTDFIPNGYLGVDIFFTISGFVVTNSLMASTKKGTNNLLSNFYIKRFKRIFPAVFFMFVISSLALFKVDYYFKSTFLTGLFSLVGASNIYLYIQSFEYFSDVSKYNSFLHTWSLGVEEQFYFFYPLLFLTFYPNSKKRKMFTYILILLSAISVILFLSNFETNFLFSYYLVLSRFWQIGAGCLLSLLLNQYKVKLDYEKNGFLLSLLFLTVFTTVNLTQYLHILVVILTLLLLVENKEGVFTRIFLKNRLITNIGLLSYSLYLWHIPVLTFSKWINFKVLTDETLFVIIIVISLFSYKFIESPIRYGNKSSHFSWKKSSLFILFITLLIVLLTSPYRQEDSNNNLNSQDLSSIYENIYCSFPDQEINDLEICFQSSDAESDIFLIGDSHVTNHYPSINRLKEVRNFKNHVLVEWGHLSDLTGVDYCVGSRSCIKNSDEKYLKYFSENLNYNDVIIFSISSFRVTTDTYPNIYKRLSEIIDIVKNNKSTLILIDDTPELCNSSDINYEFEIITMRNYQLCDQDYELVLESRLLLTSLLKSLVNENILYYDPLPLLCNDNICKVNIEDNLLYVDNIGHLSKFATQYLNKFWEEIIFSTFTANK